MGSTCLGTARREAACGEEHCPGESCLTCQYFPSGLQVVTVAALDPLFLHLWTLVCLTLQVTNHCPCHSSLI